MIVVAIVDRGGDTTEQPPTVSRDEVHHVRRLMVRVMRSEKPGEAEETAPQQLGAKRRRPVWIAPKESPRNVNERSKPPVPEWNPVDREGHATPNKELV